MSQLTPVLQKTLNFLKGSARQAAKDESKAVAKAFQLIDQLDASAGPQIRKAVEQALIAVHQRSGIDAAAMVAETMETKEP